VSPTEWTAPYAASLLGLSSAERDLLNDDRAARALTQLFDADHASLLTELIVAMIGAFDLDCRQLHNDSTTVTFSGAYLEATGPPRRASPRRRSHTDTTRTIGRTSSNGCGS
jgi:hypothetical protein